MSHPHLLNPLLWAILYSVNIIIIWISKTPYLLPTVYANILGGLWYMILTGERRLRLDIWPEILQQVESTKIIMRTI